MCKHLEIPFLLSFFLLITFLILNSAVMSIKLSLILVSTVSCMSDIFYKLNLGTYFN